MKQILQKEYKKIMKQILAIIFLLTGLIVMADIPIPIVDNPDETIYINGIN